MIYRDNTIQNQLTEEFEDTIDFLCDKYIITESDSYLVQMEYLSTILDESYDYDIDDYEIEDIINEANNPTGVGRTNDGAWTFKGQKVVTRLSPTEIQNTHPDDLYIDMSSGKPELRSRRQADKYWKEKEDLANQTKEMHNQAKKINRNNNIKDGIATGLGVAGIGAGAYLLAKKIKQIKKRRDYQRSGILKKLVIKLQEKLNKLVNKR